MWWLRVPTALRRRSNVKAKGVTRDIVRARVPEAQDPFLVVNGDVYISLLWSFGGDVEISWRNLRKLLANSRGTMIVARRLTSTEARECLQRRADCDVELHATIVHNETVRWKNGR